MIRISDAIQQAVLDLLVLCRDDGERRYSQRVIAKMIGISRRSVAKIEQHGTVRRVVKSTCEYTKLGEPPEVERCGKCGMHTLVHEPCLECKLRRLHNQITPVAHPPSDIVPELKPAEQRRYEQLRRRQAGCP